MLLSEADCYLSLDLIPLSEQHGQCLPFLHGLSNKREY